MDRALIERMVGATVLVLLLVIVAPALLDGSRPQPSADADSDSGQQLRTEVIVLNESGERSLRRAPVEIDEPESQATAVLPPPATAAAAQPVAKPVAEKPEPPVKPAQTNATTDSGYAVQLGSFRDQSNADQFAARIKRKGFPVFVQSASSSAGSVYRVYAGPRPTRDAAENLTATLAKSGYDGIVIDMSSN